MLKQVVLPAPFGPIMRDQLAGATLNETSRTACTPPKALARCAYREDAHSQSFERPDDALRKDQHQQQDHAPSAARQ